MNLNKRPEQQPMPKGVRPGGTIVGVYSTTSVTSRPTPGAMGEKQSPTGDNGNVHKFTVNLGRPHGPNAHVPPRKFKHGMI